MLEYDNSAFYYFAITLLAIYAIPATWYAIAELLRACFSSKDIQAQARTKEEREKAELLRKQTTGLARLGTTSYLLNLLGLFVAWALLFYLLSLVVRDGQVSSFDPFQILGVPQGAAVGEIKKAYRALSLKFHPDKNIGDKNAEEMFMKVAKAYEALTDATSKENYEKYGNPDGKQAMEVSIGLPKWLLENPKTVLVVYLLAMVIAIPAAVGVWYSNSKRFGDKNVLYDTYNAFYQVVNESHRAKHLVEILSVAAEFREINSTFKDSAGKTSATPSEKTQEIYDAIYETMKKEKLMIKPKFERPELLRSNLLLHAHLTRKTQLLNKELSDKLTQMLQKTPELLEGLVEIAQMRKFFETSLGVVSLSQCVAQGISPLTTLPTTVSTVSASATSAAAASSANTVSNNNSQVSLLQLPHVTVRDIERICAPTANPQVSTLRDFLRLSDAEKLRRAGLSADSEQGEELLAACMAMPRLSVVTKMFVEEEEEDDDEEIVDKKNSEKKKGESDDDDDVPIVKGDTILEQDLVTLRVTLTRENLPAESNKSNKKSNNNKKKQQVQARPVYAPRFPGTLQEGWWLVLVDRHASTGDVVVHGFDHVTAQDRVVSHEIRFLAPPRAGDYSLELLLLSDCYLGLDEAQVLHFTVRPASDLPDYTPHQEDLDLDNEPTLFEQLAAGNDGDDSSDEEDDEEDEAAHKHHGHVHGKAPINKNNSKPNNSSSSNNSKNNGSNSSNNKNSKKTAVVVEDDDSEEDDE